MATGLVLAGHGSHVSPNTAEVVWRHVDALRAMGVADEITAAFWKEQPSFHSVLHTLEADDVTIVPLFTAQGYFTQSVIPTEMGLAGAITQRDGRMIRYARTISEHPYLHQVTVQRVRDALQALNTPPEQAAVALIGHSTRRNPESRRATEQQAFRLREINIAGQVEAVYLDDHPAIAQIYDMTSAPIIIAVPYFLAAGSHTTLDVPRALGLNTLDRPQTIRGRSVFYTDPVGTEDGLREAILALARDAGLTQMQTDSSVSSDNWGCFPMMGRDVFLEAVYGTSAGLRFGELLLTREEVRVYGDDIAQRVITTPGELRAAVRESPFRSLATARGLKGGWRVPIRHSSMLHAVVETIYPGLVAEWAAQRSGTFTPRPLHDTLERQQGDYRAIIGIDAETESAVTNNVCGGCVRAPTWRSASGDLPCLEACNHWLSAALQITEAESDHS